MKKAALLALAASYFASYPGENEIHFTADQQAFFGLNDATNHANSLVKKEGGEPVIITLTRAELEMALVVTDEDLANNPELKEAGVKTGDTITVAATEEVDKALAAADKLKEILNEEAPDEGAQETIEQQREAAQAKIEKAKHAADAAQASYDEAVAKLAQSPDNKTLQKSEASRKEKLDNALAALNAAEGELAGLADA